MAADVSYSHLRQWCADGAGTHSHAASTLEMADVESHRLTNRAGWWRSALVPQTVPQDWGTPQARESTRCTDGWKTCRPGTCSHLSSHLAANDTVEVSGSSPATPTRKSSAWGGERQAVGRSLTRDEFPPWCSEVADTRSLAPSDSRQVPVAAFERRDFSPSGVRARSRLRFRNRCCPTRFR